MSPPVPPVLVAREAMATRFEIALHGADPVRLRAAAEEALSEVERIEQQLSLYDSTSEISRINALAARQPVRVSAGVFRLLEHAASLSSATSGAFDLTVGPLMKVWGFVRGRGSFPAPQAVAEARTLIGMNQVELDAPTFSVQFRQPGIMLDLGAFGKGYAVDQLVSLLRDSGIQHALVNAGTSTVYGLGVQPDGSPWKIAVELPRSTPSGEVVTEPIALVELNEEALSVSAIWGKSFQSGQRELGHVIDPRTGEPVAHTSMAAVVLPSATESDALSTAFLVLGETGWDGLQTFRPCLRGLSVGPRTVTPPAISLHGVQSLTTK